MIDESTDRSEIPITGEDLANMALADFAEFFLPDHRLTIPLSIGDTGSHASAKSKGARRWIAISRDMAGHEIDGPATFLFHLLILGHEIAHVVHEHVYAGQQQAADHSALEFWADFYGAKVMMTLITFGPRISESFQRHYPTREAYGKRLLHVGEAVDKMIAGNVYNLHPKYPAPLLRASLVYNGVTSFLRHNMGRTFTPEMYLSIFRAVMAGPSVKRLIATDVHQADFTSEPIERIQKWHREMQGDRAAITPDFYPNLLPYLHTTFDQTDEEREHSKRIRLEEMHAGGYLLDVKPADL
jgi:hypothetical protein